MKAVVRKKFAVAGTALALALTLTACGGGEDAGNAGSEQPTVEVTQEVVAAPGTLRAKTPEELAKIVADLGSYHKWDHLAAYIDADDVSELRDWTAGSGYTDSVYSMMQFAMTSSYGAEFTMTVDSPYRFIVDEYGEGYDGGNIRFFAENDDWDEFRVSWVGDDERGYALGYHTWD